MRMCQIKRPYAYGIVPSVRWFVSAQVSLKTWPEWVDKCWDKPSHMINTAICIFSHNVPKYSTYIQFYRCIFSQSVRWAYLSTGVYHCNVIIECQKETYRTLIETTWTPITNITQNNTGIWYPVQITKHYKLHCITIFSLNSLTIQKLPKVTYLYNYTNFFW